MYLLYLACHKIFAMSAKLQRRNMAYGKPGSSNSWKKVTNVYTYNFLVLKDLVLYLVLMCFLHMVKFAKSASVKIPVFFSKDESIFSLGS